MKAYSKPQFQIGDTVYVKYTYMVAKNNNKLGEYNLPSFIRWLLSYCPFDGDCVGTIVKYKPDCKVLVRFNKPIFAKHPNKMDKDGFEAYLIDKIITDKPHCLINDNRINDAVNALLTQDTFGRCKGVDSSGKPKTEYLTKLVQMSNTDLQEECENKIWLSDYTSNNPDFDFHWHCDACHLECIRRNKEYIFSNAHKNALN